MQHVLLDVDVFNMDKLIVRLTQTISALLDYAASSLRSTRSSLRIQTSMVQFRSQPRILSVFNRIVLARLFETLMPRF